MPTSSSDFDSHVLHLFRKYIGKYKLHRMCDVGAGSGKYGKIWNSIINSGDFERSLELESHTMAIELEEDYILQFELDQIYDEIFPESVGNLKVFYPDFCTQVMVFGDVLEHLPKSMGMNLLSRYVYRTNYIIAVFPRRFIQYFVDDHSSEQHISYWSENDFKGFDYTIVESTDKYCVEIVGLFSHPKAVITASARGIMLAQGCESFRGTVLDTG